MSKKEKNAWDRFWIGVKENEKVIWVILLIILAPSFAFTGMYSSCLTQARGNPVHAQMFGRNIPESEYDQARRELILVHSVQGSREFPDASEWSVLQFLLYRTEADRLGLRVSDEELGGLIRIIYQRREAQAAAQESIQQLVKDEKTAKNLKEEVLNQVYQSTLMTKFQELRKTDQFDPDKWHALLANWKTPDGGRALSISAPDLEAALRDVMKAEKLPYFVKDSVQVTSEEALEKFKQDEQQRKLTFFEVKAPDDAKAEVEKAVTDADVKARYEKAKEEFAEPIKVRVDYLSFPVAAFEKEVQITDEDLKKQYDAVKAQKYRTFADAGSLDSFKPLSPEEKAALEAKAFRPFDEVKEEVRADLLKTKSREAARAAAEKAGVKLFPKTPGTIDGKKDEKAETKPATFEEVAKEVPQAKQGSTPWVAMKDVEKDVPAEARSDQFTFWFRQLQGGQNGNPPPRKEVDAPKNYISSPRTEPQYYVFYAKPQVRPAGVRPLDEVKDRVRETLVKERLLERAADKAKAIADAIGEGKKSFDDAAKEAGSKAVTTGFLEKFGSFMVPDESAKPSTPDAAKTPPAEAEKKTKEHPGSMTIIDFAFKSLREKGKAGFVRDPENGVCYVVRYDDVIFPDQTKFEKQRLAKVRELREEKQTAYWLEWKRKLDQEAKLSTPGSQGRKGGPAPPVGEQEGPE